MSEHPASDALTGQVALVTGSTRGIGHAIASRLLDLGMDLALHGRQEAGPGDEATQALIAKAARQAARMDGTEYFFN